jgi:hypothetical protein
MGEGISIPELLDFRNHFKRRELYLGTSDSFWPIK